MVIVNRIVFMCYQEDGNGLWTISKVSMFYGLQYNEDFTKKKLHFILYILYYNIIKNAKFC